MAYRQKGDDYFFGKFKLLSTEKGNNELFDSEFADGIYVGMSSISLPTVTKIDL